MNRLNWYLFYLLSAFLLGCILFLVGFFPVDIQKEHSIKSLDPPTTLEGVSLKKPEREASNVILMVVDAFRYDFLSKNNTPHMSGQCNMQLKTNVPTVTMPRIKSLTSGTISNFIDVVLNLGTSQPLSDSILHRLHNRGDVIVFYGDDSWTKLFSSQINRYQKNTDSFFIQEFYKADEMITKNLKIELKNLNLWDFMVLHYIGLDRIGHVEGSEGEKLNLKLKEMDNVVELIDQAFSKKTSKRRPFLLVTGDHGMRNGGGHGGSSHEEIYVPLVISNRTCSGKNKNQVLEYNQVDIAPTLAVLLAIPIPSTSIGCIIPELLDGMSDEDKLYVLYYNAEFLMNKARAKFGESKVSKNDYYLWYMSAKESHKSYITTLRQQNSSSSYMFEIAKRNYIRSAHRVSDLFASSFVRFDFVIIVLGVTLTTLSTIVVLLTCITVRRSYQKITQPVVYYASISTCAFTVSFICSVCNFWSLKSIFLMTIPLAIVILLGIELVKSFLNSRLQRTAYLPLWVLCGIGFHTFSLSSTSFIEEEHQAWYYMGSTFLLILMAANISATRLKVITLTSATIERDILLFFSVLRPLKKAFIAFGLMIFLRRLNQTGDKWLHLPDIGDWFAEQTNTYYISIFLLVSLSLLVFQLKTFNTPLQTVACICACLAIYSYRGALNAVVFFQAKYFNSFLVLPLFWASTIYVLASSYMEVMRNASSDNKIVNARLVRLLGTNVTVFSLLSALLHKPHNVILVFAMNFVLTCGYRLCDNLGGPKKVVHAKRILGYKVVLTIWVSKMFFFYQGNSNNLGTIDLNPGYIGLNFYNPVLVGILLTANTYFAEIYGFLHLVLNVAQKGDEISITKDPNDGDHLRDDGNYSHVTRLMAAIKLSITGVFLILMIAFRYHLFIFTVFSPKVLYECFAMFLFYVNFSMTNLYFSVLHKILKI